MRCPECRGESFEEGRFDVAQLFEHQPVLVKNVFAQKCVQCGYLILTAKELGRIEDLLVHGMRSTVVPAAVYDMADMNVRRDRYIKIPPGAYAVATTNVA